MHDLCPAQIAARYRDEKRRTAHPDHQPYPVWMHLEDRSFVRYANPKNRYKERKISLTDEWLEVYRGIQVAE